MITQALRFKRSILSLLAGLRSLGPIPNRRQGSLRILLYHSVGNDVPDDGYGMTVSLENFRCQMEFLRTADHIDVVSMGDVLGTPGNSQNNRVIITFDDGFRDNLYNAAPVLVECRFPFTVFVTVAHLAIGGDRYLIPEEVRQLADLPGVTIGSHGARHQPLTQLSNGALTEDLMNSKMALEQITGRELSAVSYPHGKCNHRVKTAARRANYTFGAGSLFGVNGSRTDVMHLRRTEIWRTDTMDDYIRKVYGYWDWYAVYQRFRGL